MIVRHATANDFGFFNSKFDRPWPKPFDFQLNPEGQVEGNRYTLYDFHRFILHANEAYSLKLCDVSEGTKLYSPLFVRDDQRQVNRVTRPLGGLSFRCTVGASLTENWLVPMAFGQEPELARMLIREHQPLVEGFQWLYESDSALLLLSLPIKADLTFTSNTVIEGRNEQYDIQGVQRFCIRLPATSDAHSKNAMRFLHSERNRYRTLDLTQHEGEFAKDFNVYQQEVE